MSSQRVVDEMSEEEVKLELTPMIDISFLIIIFFMCLPFKTLEGKLAAFLPTDKGINPIPAEPPPEIKVKVHILARKEKPSRWGPNNKVVNKPTEFKYKLGDTGEETQSIERVGEFIRAAHKKAETVENVKVLGEIKAAHKVPHKFIIAVLNKFAENGMEKVDFYGTAIPPEALRKTRVLPYPSRNYVVSD